MSHYLIHVISDGSRSVDDLLAPYYEDLEVEPYPTEKITEALIRIRQNCSDYVKKAKENKNKDLIKKYSDALLLSDEDLLDFWFGKGLIIKDGYIMSTKNPNIKYDYYEIGGRWGDYLKSKDNLYCNEIKVSELDIKTKLTKKEIKELTNFWNGYVEGINPKNKDFRNVIWNPDYYKSKYGNLENFLYRQSINSPFAVVTPDGQWHSPGETTCFGFDTSDKDTYSEYLKWYLDYLNDPKNSEFIVTAVDCHNT